MKNILTGLYFLLSLISFGQSMEYSSTDEELRTILIGTWSLKGSDYNSQFIFFEENEELICTINQYLDEEKSPEITHQTKVEIITNDSIIELQWDYSKFFWRGRVEKVKSRRMVVEINGRDLVYVKN
jgi:hypothetical protein